MNVGPRKYDSDSLECELDTTRVTGPAGRVCADTEAIRLKVDAMNSPLHAVRGAGRDANSAAVTAGSEIADGRVVNRPFGVRVRKENDAACRACAIANFD